MKFRYITIVWWLLLIVIVVLAYIDDHDVFSNESLAEPIMILTILFAICHGLSDYYEDEEKKK